MLNRRKLFSFLATAPVATVIGAKAAMDANGNDVAPLMRGDFPTIRTRKLYAAVDCYESDFGVLQIVPNRFHRPLHERRSQSLRS